MWSVSKTPRSEWMQQEQTAKTKTCSERYEEEQRFYNKVNQTDFLFFLHLFCLCHNDVKMVALHREFLGSWWNSCITATTNWRTPNLRPPALLSNSCLWSTPHSRIENVCTHNIKSEIQKTNGRSRKNAWKLKKFPTDGLMQNGMCINSCKR